MAKLIFNKFSDKINIDEDMINSEVSRILNNQAIKRVSIYLKLNSIRNF